MKEWWKRKRLPYEFSNETKRLGYLIANNKCESCGTDHQYLQAHHILGIYHAYKHFPELSTTIIKSLANLEILCIDCHEARHLEEDIEEQMNNHAEWLATLQAACGFDNPQEYNQLIIAAFKAGTDQIQLPLFVGV